MGSSALSLTEQMLRRRPKGRCPVAHGASDHPEAKYRHIPVDDVRCRRRRRHRHRHRVAQAVPKAGPRCWCPSSWPASPAGLSAICYAGNGRGGTGFGSTYSYAYMGGWSRWASRPACLPRIRRLDVGDVHRWESVPNELLNNGLDSIPRHSHRHPGAPEHPSIMNLPATISDRIVRTAVISASERSATVNTIMVIIKLAVLAC